MSNDKQIGLRLSVTPTERDVIDVAAKNAGYSSMAQFSREIVLQVAELFQPEMPRNPGSRAWYKRLTKERKQWLIQQLTEE